MPPLGRVRCSKRTQWRKWTNKLLSNDLSPTRLVSLPYNLLQALHGDDSCLTRTPTTAASQFPTDCTGLREGELVPAKGEGIGGVRTASAAGQANGPASFKVRESPGFVSRSATASSTCLTFSRN